MKKVILYKNYTGDRVMSDIMLSNRQKLTPKRYRFIKITQLRSLIDLVDEGLIKPSAIYVAFAEY